MKELMSSVEIAQSTAIEPQEVIDLMLEMTARRDAGEDVDWYTQLAILFDRYPKFSPKIFALTQRMMCLAKVCSDPRMKGWAIQAREPDCQLTERSVFHATALARLHLVNERFVFDPDEFFSLVLSECEPEANA